MRPYKFVSVVAQPPLPVPQRYRAAGVLGNEGGKKMNSLRECSGSSSGLVPARQGLCGS